jgi:aminoglycoside/choline kinase family phosphotransferase
MSSTPSSFTPVLSVSAAVKALGWEQSEREDAFLEWLQKQVLPHGLYSESVHSASADASFRRYFRVLGPNGSFIVMDAPPDKENCQPFVSIAALFASAGLKVPTILNWDSTHGFMLLSDLGAQTMMQVLTSSAAVDAAALFNQATDALVMLQTSSKPGLLPIYDEALLRRELELFPDWYVSQHKHCVLSTEQLQILQQTFDRLIKVNLAAPQVFVHRDFMPRNLMVDEHGADERLGVLDFQDAVYGPVTYDIASLMRDAFASWDEDVCLDVTVRYWEKARKAGLMDFEDWHSDFGAFYRSVEWMGLQRHLKVAGIFARLTLRDGKPKYLADTPRFIAYMRATCSRYRELFPLSRLLDQIEGSSAAVGFSFGRV